MGAENQRQDRFDRDTRVSRPGGDGGLRLRCVQETVAL